MLRAVCLTICIFNFTFLCLAQEVETGYQAQDLRDPFYNPEYYAQEEASKPVLTGIEAKPQRPLPELTVQGIIWDTGLPQAIVNNKVVKKGDILGEVRIVDITKSGVVIIFDDQEYNLSVIKTGTGNSQGNNTQR